MPERTPITVITGPLGSGKTTLLRHMVATVPLRLAIVMNEFGEIAIDSKIIGGKNVQMAELGGGCVCCSLLGEFDAAVHEIIATVAPEWIVVETTGVAEPDAIVLDIEDNLPSVRLNRSTRHWDTAISSKARVPARFTSGSVRILCGPV
jgi:G3E family GTPase